MPLLFDYDPITQTHQYFDYDPSSDVFTISTEQDVSLLLDEIKKKRDTPEAWKKGVKDSFAHYCTIPQVVEMELKKKGINIYDKGATQLIIKEIEQNYPHLKTTEAKLWRPKTKK